MKYITQHPIKKSDLGFHGNLFGGKLLAWLDAAAAGCAGEFCDTPRMVTKAGATDVQIARYAKIDMTPRGL